MRNWVAEMTSGLVLGEDGIWYSPEQAAVSYPDEGNDACFAVEERSFWFRHRNACVIAAVETFPPASEAPVVDLGGGNGFVAAGLIRAGIPAIVVEPGKRGAAHAQERGVPVVICSTFERAGFLPGTIPAIGLFDVVEHIADDHAFLRQCERALVTGGMLYVTVPAYNALWSDEDILARHFRRYSLQEVQRRVANAGFQIVFATYFFRWLPIPIALFRVLPYRIGLTHLWKKDIHVPRGHAAHGRTLERFIWSVLAHEPIRIRQKKSISWGSSCLIVAQKP